LHIKIRDGQSFKIEMYDSYSKNDDEILEDISPILLDKNRNIIVEPPSKKP
jgi:Ulp1 family protease